MHDQPRQITAAETANLLQRIQTFLHGQHIPALRNLEVEVSGDTAVIHGKVGTYYERQVSVECCKRVAGVRKVIDLIKVTVSKEGRMTGATHRPLINGNPTKSELMS